MDIIKKIIDTHSKICTCEKKYKIDSDVEITVRQNENYIYMFAYNEVKDKNMSIYSNYKKIYRAFEKISERISQDKDYYLKIYLKSNEKNEKVETKNIEKDIDKNKEFEKLQQEIAKLKGENILLRDENNFLKLEIEKCLTIKNERGAGRKQKFTDEQIKQIKQLRENQMSIRNIAKEFNCSVGLIHKLINENNKNENSKNKEKETLEITIKLRERLIKDLNIKENNILYQEYQEMKKQLKELE